MDCIFDAGDDMIEVLKQALDALEFFNETAICSADTDISNDAIASLQQAIAELEKKEPVAWRYALDASVEGPRWIYIDKDPHQWLLGPAMAMAVIEKLYTHPPQRTEQEPVGYAVPTFDFDNSIIYKVHYEHTVPLYAHPPQRTWVGLTDEDCKNMSAGDKVVAMWADRTLKEKNNA